MNELTVLKNMVRTGWVSSVDTGAGTARVSFQDKGETFVSGPLKVLKNPPFLPANKVTQQTGPPQQPGSIQSHTHALTVTPWMPVPGEFVLCLYLPNGDGDGFILGGV